MAKPKPDAACLEIAARRGMAERIGEACGVSGSAVRQWLKVPANRALKVAGLLGWNPHRVRPDIYPRQRKPRST